MPLIKKAPVTPKPAPSTETELPDTAALKSLTVSQLGGVLAETPENDPPDELPAKVAKHDEVPKAAERGECAKSTAVTAAHRTLPDDPDDRTEDMCDKPLAGATIVNRESCGAGRASAGDARTRALDDEVPIPLADETDSLNKPQLSDSLEAPAAAPPDDAAPEPTQRMEDDGSADADDRAAGADELAPPLDEAPRRDGEERPAAATAHAPASAANPGRATPAAPASAAPAAPARRGFTVPTAAKRSVGFAPPIAKGAAAVATAAAGSVGAAQAGGAGASLGDDETGDEQPCRARKSGAAKPRKPRESKGAKPKSSGGTRSKPAAGDDGAAADGEGGKKAVPASGGADEDMANDGDDDRKERKRVFATPSKRARDPTSAAGSDGEEEGDDHQAVLDARRARKRARKEAKAAKSSGSGGEGKGSKRSRSASGAKEASKPQKPSRAARKAEREASGEPKRPKSAYFYYSEAEMKRLRAGDAKVSMTESAKAIGAAWRELADTQKQPFAALAAVDAARYATEKSAWDKLNSHRGKTFATPSPKKAAAKPTRGSGSSPKSTAPRRLQPAAASALDEVAHEGGATLPKAEVWIAPAIFAPGDRVVWFPRGLAELCDEEAHKTDLQTAGLLAGAVELSKRTESEVRARVVRAEQPPTGSVAWTLALADDERTEDGERGGGAEYALPFIPAPECEVAQHIVQLAAFEAAIGKFREGDHISMPFGVPGGERRADGSVRGELWEGRIYDVDESCGAFGSLSVIWYEQLAQTGAWFMSAVQNDTSISPHECQPSEAHALWAANNGGPPPPSRRVLYGKAPELKATTVDDLDIAPADTSLGEYARVALLRLSTLESSKPFLCPVTSSDAAYHAAVPSPISLREMEAKLAKGEYRALEQLEVDVKTLINNAFVANGDDVLVFHQARELDKEWTRIKAELAAPAPPPADEDIDVARAPVEA